MREKSKMVSCRDDPCGFVCMIITYGAVFYADYVVVEWLIVPSSLSASLWGALHALIFNSIILLLIVSHLRAVLSDPGIVPLPSTAIDFSDVRSGNAPKSRIDKLSGESWTVCQKCEAYRPPRAHHCRICRRCIRKMDHHCPWINNCVGEFNQKYFIQFLFYVGMAAVYSIFLLVISWTRECPSCSDMDEKNARIAHSIVLVVISILFGLFVCAIGCDQITAIFEDETLVEQIKNKGQHREVIRRSKMDLLREVFGKGPIWWWMVPCRSTPYKRFIPPSFNV
ncbi:palmitoyltransferase ZDHHC7-like [Diadema antillarum]|uniref:palmitoyltransferase ZDHHC7-like n=1 Tax=Diadema antillarum TaxID=105358 RepID=UPI003A83D752